MNSYEEAVRNMPKGTLFKGIRNDYYVRTSKGYLYLKNSVHFNFEDRHGPVTVIDETFLSRLDKVMIEVGKDE